MFWEGNTFDFDLSASIAFVTMVSEANIENTPNATLIRIRGEGLIQVEAVSGAGAGAVIALGIMPQSARSIAAGAGGMPTPFGNVGSAWIWHTMIPVHVNNAVESSGLLGSQSVRFTIDNKAMRKFDLNQGLVMVAQNVVRTGTVTVKILGATRVLFKI
jgi:hypothetical protein